MKKIIFTLFILFLAPIASAQSIYFDDSGPNFSTTGSWTSNSKTGAYLNNHTWSHFLHPSGGGNTPGLATWDVTSAAGEYEVLVRWHVLSNRATDAEYSISFDGGQLSTPQVVDQTSSAGLDPEGFLSLGTYCDPTEVHLSNIATQSDTPVFTGYVSADAVKLIKVGSCGTGSGMSGSATIPLYETQTITSSYRSESFYYIGNVTNEVVDVSIKFYDGSTGNLIIDDGSPTSGMLQSTFNTGASYDDTNGITFELSPRSTARVLVNDTGAYTMGHGEVSWSSTNPISGGKALVVSGQVYHVNGDRTYSRLINVNGGLPF